MTAAALTYGLPRSEPTIAVCAGRVLMLAGLVFGSANLLQWAILGGALDLHPALLGLSWTAAVGLFLIGLFRLRRIGGEAGRRVAGWSRALVLVQLGAVLALAGLSASTGDWALMRWSAVIGLVFYAMGWAVAAVRTGRPNMGALFLVALAGAGAAAARLGMPDQSLIHASTLALSAFLPGLWLTTGRRL